MRSVRVIRTGGVGEGEAGGLDTIVAAARCNFCGRRVQQAFSGVLRKGEVDSQPSIQLRQFHAGRGTGARRSCRRAPTGNGRALSPAIGRERFDFAPMRTYGREIGIVWHPRLVSIRPQSESVLAGLKEIVA